MNDPSESNIEISLSKEEAAAAGRLLARLLGDSGKPAAFELQTLACRIHEARRERDGLFPEDVFADPAWDIVLSLYCAEARGEKLSVTALGHSVGLPQTTALRWINELAGVGLIERQVDDHDRRRSFLMLTRSAHERLTLWLRKVVSLMGSLLDKE